jgi:integrase
MNRRPKGTGSAWLRQDGRWEGQITAGRDENGKRIVLTRYGDNEKEIFEKLEAAKREFEEDPKRISQTHMSLDRFTEVYWFPAIGGKVSGKTLDRYRLDLGYIRPYLGEKRLVDLSSRDILTAYSQMQLAGQTEYQRFKGAKMLRQALKLAVRLEYIRRNPADDFPLPRFTKEEVHPMTPEQLKQFLEANREDHLYAVYVVAADTGARQGELFALEWSDWFPESRELSFSKAVEDHKGILRLKESKTKSSRRRVVISARTAGVLEEHRKKMLQEAEYQQSQLIFPNVDGTWLRCSNFHRDHWQPALKRAGVKGFRFQDLRHTCATLLLMAGDNVNSVADRLGHSSPEMIWRTYGDVLPRRKQESAALMEQFL